MSKDTSRLVSELNGKWIEVAGKSPNQCTDLVNYWLRMLGLPMILGRNAIDFKNAPGYTYIKNTIDFVPQEGDIAIFDIGDFGDVAVVRPGTTRNKLVVFGQNFPLKAKCRERTHINYSGVDGFLVLSGGNTSNPNGGYMKFDLIKKRNEAAIYFRIWPVGSVADSILVPIPSLERLHEFFGPNPNVQEVDSFSGQGVPLQDVLK